MNTQNIQRSGVNLVHDLSDQSMYQTTTETPPWPGNGPQASWCWAEHHLERATKLLLEATSAEGVLGECSQFHFASHGKRLRAKLALAVSHCYGVDPDSAVHAAAACELLHNASLVHDDLQDKDLVRRGRPAIWHEFSPEAAINLGDYFIIQTYALLARTPCQTHTRSALVAAFSRAAACTIQGQVNETALQGDPSATIEAYEYVATAKSGTLLALPVRSAMALSHASLEHTRHACEALQLFGLAYQIQDDIGDLLGFKDLRQAGSDIRTRKLTAPAIFYLQRASAEERNSFSQFLNSCTPSDHTTNSTWLDRIVNSKALADCERHLQSVSERMRLHLERLPTHLRQCLEYGIANSESYSAQTIPNLIT